MQLTHSKKAIGISFCIFFGILTVSYIYHFLVNLLGFYNPAINPVTWIITNFICCVAFCIIFFNSRKNALVRTGSAVLAVVNLLFTVNVYTHLSGINIFSFLGEYYSFILSIIELAAAGLIFFGMKAWAPVQIVGFSYFIPNCVSAFYISSLESAYRLLAQTGDFTIIEKILNAMNICDVICFIIVLASFILTVIWLNKKPIAASTVSESINLI